MMQRHLGKNDALDYGLTVLEFPLMSIMFLRMSEMGKFSTVQLAHHLRLPFSYHFVFNLSLKNFLDLNYWL